MYSPQTWRVVKHKESKGLSRIAFSIAAFGTSMWMIYVASQGSFVDIAPGWIANAVISTMMLPIIFYLFKDTLWKRYILYAIIVTAWVVSLLLTLTGTRANVATSIILVLLAGASTSFGYIPQLIKIFQTKETGELSIILVVVYGIVNALWVIYWGGYISLHPDEPGVPSEIISCCLSGTGLFVQGAIAIAYFKYNKKKA